MLKVPLLYGGIAALVHFAITKITDLQSKGGVGMMTSRR
jgi:hypothetical protein